MTEHKKYKAWVEAMRLRTLPVGAASVVAGCGLAAFYSSFKLTTAFLCLLFALLAQIASNFANEYYDFRNGLDRKGREGFRRGVTEGDISPAAMRNATFATLGAAAATGLALIPAGGWWIIVPGIAIAVFALAYSTGPFPLSHHGLGDIAVIIFFGLVPVTLTCYLQAGLAGFSPMSLLIALATGLLAANVLMVNNYRDMEDDAAVGKHTTAVIFGRKILGMIYLVSGLTAAALTSVAIYPHAHSAIVPCIILGILYILLYIRLRRSVGAALNPLLGMTAMVLLLFSFASAIILSVNPI